MSTPHTPSAEAVEAGATALAARYHGAPATAGTMVLYAGEAEAVLAAALPHLRRQIVAECVEVVTGRLAMLRKYATTYPEGDYKGAIGEAEEIEYVLTTLLDAPTKEGDDA